SFLGLVGLVVAFELWMVGVAGLALMIGAGAFQAANWATLSEAVPDEEGAAYLGLSNLATAGASALVGLLGPLVDVANALIPAGTYAIIFSIAALCAVVAYLPTRGQDVPSGAQKKR